MGFWNGVIIGLFIGTNVGIVLACLLAGSRRDPERSVIPADWMHMDEAVMENAPLAGSKVPRPLIPTSAEPIVH
jgi:hypothetical protein